MIIAESNLFKFIDNEWEPFNIKMHKPEPDEVFENTHCCTIEIGNDEKRNIHGIDSLQTIILAVGYLGNRMKQLKENGLELYHNKRLDHKVDIDVFLRNDLSFYRNMKTNRKTDNQ
jgi:predicted transcriptional regulator